jgi:hypothetical protein
MPTQQQGDTTMIYAQIDEDDFIDRMNKAHESTTHGFSDDGLKALFKYLESNPRNPIFQQCYTNMNIFID